MASKNIISSEQIRKRTRASGPKVTTGCVTCKIRHIKCDEAKPACQKCLNTGRKCDGYRSPSSRKLLASAVALSLDLLPRNHGERKFFQLFSTRIVSQLTGLFGSSFWERHVLQASLHEPAIWHALVAVGAAFQTVNPTFQPGIGEVGRIVESGSFAVHQYLKAMGYLTNPSPKNEHLGWDVALTCCVLFVCLECLRGRYEAAIGHLDSGIRLLSEQRSKMSKGGHNERQPQRASYCQLQDLEVILMRLDTQASQMLSTRKPLYPPSYIHSIQPGLKFLKPLETLEAARIASDYLWNSCLYTLAFPTHTQTIDNTTLEFGHTPASSLQACSSKFEAVSFAIQEFLERYSTKGNKLDAKEQRIVSIMQIDLLIAKLCMKSNIAPDLDNEEHWDEHNAEFSEIIFRASEVIDSHSESDGEAGPRQFCLDTSVVGPLYFVACRCRHKILRRKAISLLRTVKRQEGLWNSSMLAGITEEILRIEEGLGDNGEGEQWTRINVAKDVPAESRIVDVVLDFQGESEEADVRCLTTKGSSILKGDGRLMVTWS